METTFRIFNFWKFDFFSSCFSFHIYIVLKRVKQRVVVPSGSVVPSVPLLNITQSNSDNDDYYNLYFIKISRKIFHNNLRTQHS